MILFYKYWNMILFYLASIKKTFNSVSRFLDFFICKLYKGGGASRIKCLGGEGGGG